MVGCCDPLNLMKRHLPLYFSEIPVLIISEWLERVRADEAIMDAERLSTIALTNHLPEIFENLINTLPHYGSEVVAGQSVKDAGEHGSTRLRQGYELPEMLREFMQLRAILIYHLREFKDMHAEFGAASCLFIVTTLHRFIDEMIIDGTESICGLS